MATNIEYFEALERLKSGNPQKISKPYTINKDTVALEAGRKRGSIKKSRDSHHALILAIDEASTEQAKKQEKSPTELLLDKLEKEKAKSEKYRLLYEESLGREISLVNQIHSLQLKM